MISPNVIIMWPGTNAAIPSGYTRETTLDSRYPKGTGAAVEPGVNDGNVNHQHSSPSHSHTVTSHTHSGNYTGYSLQESGDPHTDYSGSVLPNANHRHTYSYSTIYSSSTTGETVTYLDYPNDPPYYTVIFVKATGFQAVPDDCVLFFNDTSIPSGFARHTAADDRYYKGAGTVADGGDTDGSTTNAHLISHTHTTYHIHRNISGYPSTGSTPGGHLGDNKDSCGRDHRHYIKSNNKSIVSGSNSTIGNNPGTVEPAYKKLLSIQNTSGSSKIPQPNMVAMWLGNLADIPVGWNLCDGNNGTQDMRGKYVKNAATTGEIGNTGGSNTHTHTAESHNHSIAGHTHTGSDSQVLGGGTGLNQRGRGGAVAHRYWTGDAGQHTVGTSTSSAATSTSSANTTAQSANNEPQYRTVAFIQYEYMVAGSLLFGLL